MKKFTLKDILSSAAKWEPPEKCDTIPKQEPKKEKPDKPKPEMKEKRKYSPLPTKTDFNKDFMKLFDKLTYSKRKWAVWEDFIVLFACTISNAVDRSKEHYDIREKRYLRTIKKYTKEEAEIFPELAANVICALSDNPEQDYLGHLFMLLNLGDDHHGQCFTPYHVSSLMADMTCTGIDDFYKVHTVNDCACGAGTNLIAAFHCFQKQYQDQNLNAQNYIMMYAQDIDEIVALMCYIQLSLLGIAAMVKVGNSLTDPMRPGDSTENYWYTPMYYIPPWSDRRLIQEVCDLMKGETSE